jgi:hypothetical protein
VRIGRWTPPTPSGIGHSASPATLTATIEQRRLSSESDASYNAAVPTDSVIESAFRSKLLELPGALDAE